jgi:DNA polymerase-3 subunit delta'
MDPQEAAPFAGIEGQEGATRSLSLALQGGRLGSAYLFVGPSGVGKQRAALALARAALCDREPAIGCGACDTCHRIDAGVHPDVRVFEPRSEGNRNLPVEFLRSEILPLTKFAPFEAKAAFVVFPQADVSFPVQHPEAANALLKTLEEPRKNLHFILLSERPDRLLPTIRSRCQRLRFAPLPDRVLLSILERAGVPDAERSAAVELAGGRADIALALSKSERATALLDWTLRLDSALAQNDFSVFLALGEELAGDEHRTLVLEALMRFYRDLARVALGVEASAESLATSTRGQALYERARRLSVRIAAERVAKIAQLLEDLESSNANAQIALEGLLFELGAA